MRIEHIGDATLILADCMDIMRDMPDKAFDLAIVDPPYGININMNMGRRAGQPKAHIEKPWDSSTPPLWYFEELVRVTENQIVWGGNYFNLPITAAWIFWDKQVPVGVSFADGELAWTSFQGTLVKANIPYSGFTGSEGKIHPTQKPVALYKWLLSRYAKPGDTILDTHGGSGSSVVACLDMGYPITWIEKDEDYFNAALKRIEIAYQQPRLFDEPRAKAVPQELPL